MGSFCGSSPQTVITSASNPNVTAQQDQIYKQINDYASRFGGNPSALVAPWNPLQTASAQGVADAATSNQPFINLGEGMVGQGSNFAGMSPEFYGAGASAAGNVNPITGMGWNPTPYESPFTNDVINATRANIEQSNAVAQNGALGNLIQSGTAFGGDRAGVTMAELARNQGLAENQTLAALQQANFNQASQQANAQQQYLLNLGQANNAQQLQAGGLYGQLGSGLTNAGLAQGNLGYQLGNLANLGQQSQLGAWQGLYNMGVGLQGTQQQQLSAPLTFGQWYGNASPGTQQVPTSTTYPGSSPLATIAGLGLTGLAGGSLLSSLGAFAPFVKDGGRITGKSEGGAAGSHEEDLVGRFHRMKALLHRDMGGGAGGPNVGVPGALGQGHSAGDYSQAIINGGGNPAQKNPVEQAYQLRRFLQLSQGAGQAGKMPGTSEADIQQMQTPQAARGGAIGRDDGGPVDGTSVGDGLGEPSSPDMAAIADKNRAKQFKSILDLAHKGMDYLSNQNSPTQAPHAPGPTDWSKMLGSMSGLGGLGGGQDTGWMPEAGEARGGSIGTMGRKHFDDGGGADVPDFLPDVGQLSNDAPGIMGGDSYDPRGSYYLHGTPERLPRAFDRDADFVKSQTPPVEYTGREQQSPQDGNARVGGSDVYRAPQSGGAPETPRTSWSSPAPQTQLSPEYDELRRLQIQQLKQQLDPRYTALNMGLRILGHAGERDAHGLPLSGAAQIGRGASEGLEKRADILSGITQAQKAAIEAAKAPAEMEHLAATSALARTQADKDFLLHIEKQKQDYAKQLENEQTRQRLLMLQEMRRSGQLGNPQGGTVPHGHYPWDPTILE